MDTPTIVLTTDFGAADAYVGVMKGVILGINPKVTIVDLTHQVQPQNIRQAAFILAASYRFFPPAAIHVVVVDPGVGTERRALLVTTPMARFLAPDNGVLSSVIQDYLDMPTEDVRAGQGGHPGLPRQQTASQSARVLVPAGCAAYQLTNRRYWLNPVSDTFHGRDVFAPVAAHLSLGVRPEDLGTPIHDLVWLPIPEPTRQGDTIQGQVIYIDHFGNLVTNIPAVQLVEESRRVGTPLQVKIKGQTISRLSRAYRDADDPARLQGGHPSAAVRAGSAPHPLALIGSHGYLEVALRDGNAAAELGISIGEPVYVFVTP